MNTQNTPSEQPATHSGLDWERECNRLRVSLVDADNLIGELIKERDHRDEIIDKLCDEVLGPDRPEWSSAYGFDDAVSDVEERMAAIEKPAPAQEPLKDERTKLLWHESRRCIGPRWMAFKRLIEAAHGITSGGDTEKG